MVWPGQGKPPAFAEELLSEASLKEKGYFDPASVTLLRQQSDGIGDTLTQVLGLQLWDEQFTGGRRAGL